jgi:dTDP-4-amino-4,6-dideoxygalactose transaminase
LGDFGAFSFYPAKHMTTGEGGMLVSKDETKISEARKAKAFYYSKNVGERNIPGNYDIVGFGLNLRMSEMSAAIGIEQLKKLPKFLQIRLRNIETLTAGFESYFGSFLDYICDYGVSGIYCSSFVLKREYLFMRDPLIVKLKDLGIGCSIYYPVSLPESSYYRANPNISRNLGTPIAQYLASASIAFGVGPHLSDSDMLFIRDVFEHVLKEELS